MSNYKRTKAEVKNYIYARTQLIILDSSERERAERMLREIAETLQIEIFYYTDARQVSILGNHSFSADTDQDPLAYIADLFKKKRNCTFVYADVRRIGEDNSYSRELLNILYLAREQNCTLILITGDPVWSRLAQFGMLTSLDYPDMEERSEQIHRFTETFRGRFLITWTEEEIRRAATLLRGFSEIQIENILSAELTEHKGLGKEHLSALTRQKSRLYAAVSSIQQVNIKPDLKVIGLEKLKCWLDEKKILFFAPDEELKKRDLEPPKGILLAGMPGCGKSYSARMVAKEWEMPLFRFDIGSVYDKWVGESEKKMREALRFIDNVAPCVVWIDEIEKALAVSESGNDTGKRVLGQFLFWLQESESRVFLVATANDISALPMELFRKGRFSEVFFVDLPNRTERRSVIEYYLARTLEISVSEEEMENLVDLARGFSYSDIEYAIKDVAQLALVRGQESVDGSLLADHLASVISVSERNPDAVASLREWGRKRAVSASAYEEEGT